MVENPQRLFDLLNERGEPCPVCEYELHQISEPRCPECGTDLHLTVGAALPRLAPWTSAVVWCAMGLGFDVVACLMWLVVVIPIFFFGTHASSIAALFAGPLLLFVAACVCASGIVWLLRGRERWIRRRAAVQWWRSAGIFAAVTVFHLGIAVGIMLIR